MKWVEMKLASIPFGKRVYLLWCAYFDLKVPILYTITIRVATWQNQQSECAPSEDSDQPGWLCWGLTSQSTIFQSCRDGAIASWVINQYFRGVKCLAQGHNTAAVGLEPRTSRSGVRHSTTEPPRSPRSAWASIQFDQRLRCPHEEIGPLATHWAHSEDSDQTGRMPRLIWVFAGRTATLLVLSRGGSITVLSSCSPSDHRKHYHQKINDR